jgi:uncharacterized protein with PIN domain
VKVILDRIGIPPSVIDLILVNSNSVNLLHQLEENDLVSLYPVIETLNISSISKLREYPLRRARFVLDVHLGKLANHLRMLGFDTLYQNNFTDEILLSLSINECRILLSKDKSLLRNETLTHAYYIKGNNPQHQLEEILERFDLYELATPFTRCIECNSLLQYVDKKTILSRIPSKVKEWCDEYLLCVSCDRIYWKGSHYQHMNTFIQKVLQGRSLTDQSDKSI